MCAKVNVCMHIHMTIFIYICMLLTLLSVVGQVPESVSLQVDNTPLVFRNLQQVFMPVMSSHYTIQYMIDTLQFHLYPYPFMEHTAQKGRRRGEKDQRLHSNSGPMLYISRSFSHASHRDRSRSFVPHCPYVPVTGVPLSSDT